MVSELIDYGANVSQPNNKGFTPLHFAAASTHGALCLEFLVNSGADVNVQVCLLGLNIDRQSKSCVLYANVVFSESRWEKPSSSDGCSWAVYTVPDAHSKR